MQTNNALLEVTDLNVAFRQGKEWIPRVDGVNLKVYPGEIVCLVGESGCGKSVTALACMGLLPRQGRITGGSIRFEGRELTGLDEDGLDQVRGSGMGMIFQDVMNSLNPVLPIGLQMTEGSVRRGMDRARAREKTIALLREQAPWVKVMVGGAVLTREYAQSIGADGYGKDAMAGVRLAEEWEKA